MIVPDTLAAHPELFFAAVALVSLLIGSFLNVVIYRLPVMMERDWHRQARELLEADEADNGGETFNIMVPRSRCQQCGHQITAIENIPLVSYLWLRGKCSACGNPISLRYPAVELATALLSVVVAWRFGPTWQCAGALVLTWALIALALIDLDHHLLPDSITLPFLWLGLVLSLFTVFTDSQASIVGATAGYVALWAVYHAFRIATGKEGMGHGDFKLLAMLGAWMGWSALPVVIVLSSVVGAAVGVGLILLGGHERSRPLPFGPFLAAAGWITLLWGNDLTRMYLHWAGVAL